ncbi:polysaccharide biosynthesis/export family protein [Spirosoma koreense]
MNKKNAERKPNTNRIRVSVAVVAAGIAAVTACTSPKKLAYFQGTTSREDTVIVAEPFSPTIKKGDVLAVQVSSLNAEASAYFNPTAVAETNPGITPANPLTRSAGYLVDANGTIELPLVGQVTLVDLTNAKAAELIRNKLKVYLKEPTVTVRNLNFRISVLGEVSRPSLFTIPNEQITLPEALGLAGDLTIYGRRDNVLVIRQEGNQRIFARLDLTRRDAFRSPYYALHPNDVVYVEPNKVRVTSVDRVFILTPIVTGILSLVAIIATRR